MTDHGFALFETAVGPCGIAWGPDGILGVQLPEGDAARTRARLARRFTQAREVEAPEPVRSAIAAIQALLAGEARDLSQVALDWSGIGSFERRVYEVARAIRPGATLTYGELAARIGEGRSRPGARTQPLPDNTVHLTCCERCSFFRFVKFGPLAPKHSRPAELLRIPIAVG